MGVGKVSDSKNDLMVPFDRPHTISYQSFIATMSLSCTASEMLFKEAT